MNTCMDEELSAPDFNCVDFIEKHLTGTDIDLKLTDLTFSLQLINQESQQQIQMCSQQISQHQDSIAMDSQELFRELIEFKEILSDYIAQVAPYLAQENPLYSKLEECLTYKNNISQSLGMFECVMQLDDLYESYARIIEENDIQDLYDNVTKNIKLFGILLELPKMNPRYGQIERIVTLIEQYCVKDLFTCQHYALKFALLDMLKVANSANAAYIEQRIKTINVSAVNAHSQLSVQEAQEIVNQMITITEHELTYLKNIKQFQGLFNEFLRFLIGHFNKHVFKWYFCCENQYNRNSDVLYAYLTYYTILNSYCEKGYITMVNFKNLLKLAFDPYSATIKIIIKNESNLLASSLLKKLNQGKNVQEKLSNFELNCQDLLEQSFKRTADLSFNLAYEDWICETVKVVDDMLTKMSNILDEIQQDSLGIFVSQLISNNQPSSDQVNQQQPLSTKLLLRQQLTLFETLIIRHNELTTLYDFILVELDLQIKQTLDKSQIDELNKHIAIILREKLQFSTSRHNSYSNELSIASSLRLSIEECLNKITIMILRLLLSESLNQEADFIHNFTTNLEYIENIYKTIKPAKLSYKLCVTICPKLSYEELDSRAQSNYFSLPTCYWAALYIICEVKLIKIPELKQLYNKFIPYDAII